MATEDEKLNYLARWVLTRFMTKAERAEWLRDEYERRHGKAATDKLKAVMLRVYQEMKNNE